MPGLTNDQKKDKLSRISYKTFLLDYVKVDPSVIPFYQTRTHGLSASGSTRWARSGAGRYNYPGFEGMNLDPKATGHEFYSHAATRPEGVMYAFISRTATRRSRSC
jgi:spermidine dehydrogenase